MARHTVRGAADGANIGDTQCARVEVRVREQVVDARVVGFEHAAATHFLHRVRPHVVASHPFARHRGTCSPPRDTRSIYLTRTTSIPRCVKSRHEAHVPAPSHSLYDDRVALDPFPRMSGIPEESI